MVRRLLLLVATLALFASACSGGGGGGGGSAPDKGSPIPTGQTPGATGQARITFDLQARQGRISDAAVNILINILNPVTQVPLAQPVTVPVDRSGPTQTVTITVPVGDVLLLVETLDANGNVLDVGSGVVTVTENTISSISITLRPFDQTIVGIPSVLVFVTQPTTVGQNSPIPPVQVAVQDGNGLLIASATDSITLALANNPTGAVLSGSVTVNAVNGVATFPGLSINRPGTGYTLIAAATSRNSALSDSFDIAAVPASLAITVPPTTTPQLSPITPGIQVSILDQNGVVVPGATNQVTVALASGTGTLSGTLSVPAVNGVATFSDLSIDQVQSGVTFSFSSAGLAGATSAPINVTNAPGVPTQIAFLVQPANTNINQTITPPVQVVIQDFQGATVANATNQVTLTLASGSGNLNGTLTLPAVNGVAVFNNLSLNTAGVGFVLGASSPGLTGASSSAFNINAVVGPPVPFRGVQDFIGVDGSGNPRFAAPNFCPVGDFNDDGRLDFATGDQVNTGNPHVFLNTTATGSMVPTFSAFQIQGSNSGAFAVGSADFNGDNLPDLCSNPGNANFQILLNQTASGASTPVFGPPSTFLSSAGNGLGGYSNFDFADFNGDGKVDIALGFPFGNGFSVLLNTTSVGGNVVSFNAPNEFTAGAHEGFVAVGDVDGDNRPDIVQGGNSALFVSLNTTPALAANATFAPAVQFLPPSGTVDRVALGDFDADGRLDVVSADRAENGVRVWRNQSSLGTALFTQVGLIATGNFPQFVHVADFNADGRADIAANNTSGSTVAPVNKNSVSVLLNQNLPGAIGFQPVNNFPATRGSFGISTGDFNDDNVLDMAVASADNFGFMTNVMLGTTPVGATAASFSQGDFLQSGNAPSAVAEADFNGDNELDLIVANRTDDTATIYTSDGAGGFTTSTVAVGTEPVAVYVADLNNDARPDALTVNNLSSNITVLMNTTVAGGTPTFTVGNFGVGAQPQRAAVADLNRDGRPDISVSLTGGNFIRVFINTTAGGALTFSADPSPTDIPFANPGSVVAGDFNGDNILDLAGVGGGFGDLVVFPNTTPMNATAATFGTSFLVDNFLGFLPMTSADVNADGRPDLILSSVAVYMNTTTGGALSFQETQLGNVGGNLFIVAKDANADGLPDLVVGVQNGSDIAFMRNTTAVGAATATFARPLYFQAGDFFSIPFNGFFGGATVADVTGDGLADIVVAAPGTGSLNPATLGSTLVIPQLP